MVLIILTHFPKHDVVGAFPLTFDEVFLLSRLPLFQGFLPQGWLRKHMDGLATKVQTSPVSEAHRQVNTSNFSFSFSLAKISTWGGEEIQDLEWGKCCSILESRIQPVSWHLGNLSTDIDWLNIEALSCFHQGRWLVNVQTGLPYVRTELFLQTLTHRNRLNPIDFKELFQYLQETEGLQQGT